MLVMLPLLRFATAGTLLLYDTSKMAKGVRQDEIAWQTKKKGTGVREDHVKLKVNHKPMLNDLSGDGGDVTPTTFINPLSVLVCATTKTVFPLAISFAIPYSHNGLALSIQSIKLSVNGI